MPNLPSKSSYDKDKDKDKDKDESISRAKRFTPPTLDDVSAYIRERGSNVDAQRFLDFYTAKGWMIGKNRMKDWKAAVRTWEKRDSEQNKPFVYDYGNTEGSL